MAKDLGQKKSVNQLKSVVTLLKNRFGDELIHHIIHNQYIHSITVSFWPVAGDQKGYEDCAIETMKLLDAHNFKIYCIRHNDAKVIEVSAGTIELIFWVDASCVELFPASNSLVIREKLAEKKLNCQVLGPRNNVLALNKGVFVGCYVFSRHPRDFFKLKLVWND